MPFSFIETYWTLVYYDQITRTGPSIFWINKIIEALFVINTIIDPIIYVTRVPEVRSRLQSAVQCVQRPRPGIVIERINADNTNVTVTRSGQPQLPEHIAMT